MLENYTFLPFSVFLAIFWVFTYKKVPETKNKTFDEIATLFKIQNKRISKCIHEASLDFEHFNVRSILLCDNKPLTTSSSKSQTVWKSEQYSNSTHPRAMGIFFLKVSWPLSISQNI